MRRLIERLHYALVHKNIHLYTCRDCFSEAEMACQIYSYDRTIPPQLRNKFNKAYRQEFYFAHLSFWGLRTRVRPFA